MWPFGRKRSSEQRRDIGDEGELESSTPGEGEEPGGEESAEDSPRVQEAAESPEEPGGEDTDGREPTAPQQGADFFELTVQEVQSYRTPGFVAARRKHRNLKPLLAVLLGLVAIGGIVVLVVFLWPSSTAKIPQLVGKALSEAKKEARESGFETEVSDWAYSRKHEDGVVIAQSPAKNEEEKKGTVIVLSLSKGPPPPAVDAPEPPVVSADPSTTTEENPLMDRKVCIDAGHQKMSSRDEWADPSMTKRKPGPDPGARGVLSQNPEYLITIDVARRLEDLLEKDGVTVVMTREQDDVDLGNVSRAEVGNSSEVDLTISIHCGDSADAARKGAMTFYPAESDWSEGIYEQSKTAAIFVEADLAEATEMEDLGTFDRHDLVLFNWSSVPVIQVEIGFLSNVDDDALLSREEFRKKVAWGLRNGIIEYLGNL